jgi:hypothetical protein
LHIGSVSRLSIDPAFSTKAPVPGDAAEQRAARGTPAMIFVPCRDGLSHNKAE